MDRSTPVVVVGAGIAGMTAALCFAKAGFAVEIFERAPRLKEAGAGLQLSPNALRVLERLGLMEALTPDACAANAVTLRSGATGRRLAEIPVLSSDGTSYLSLHRTDLQTVLLAAVSQNRSIVLTLGAELMSVGGADAKIELEFRVGGHFGEDPPALVRRLPGIVIAADGVRSAVARELGHPGPSSSGDLAWRMTIDRPSSCSASIEAWLGPGRHAVAYPLRGGRQTNLVLIEPEAGGGDPAPPGADRPALLHRFRHWDQRLLDMIAAAGPATAWPLLEIHRNDRTRDPAGLLMIGDAAHALLPYAAQGAAMAIEDAWMAAKAFAESQDPREAVARFGAERDPRIRRVRDRVAFHRMVYHLPPPFSAARDLVLRLRSRQALARDLGWLYDWTPPPLEERPPPDRAASSGP